MATATDSPPASEPEKVSVAPKLATISAVISSAGAVVAATCAIISTSHLLAAVQIDAQQKVFALKLEACDSFGETTTAISTNPIIAASSGDDRRKMVRSANRLVMLFPEQVRSAGLRFINQMDIVRAARPAGPQDVALSMKLGSVVQSAIELEQACQNDLRKNASISE